MEEGGRSLMRKLKTLAFLETSWRFQTSLLIRCRLRSRSVLCHSRTPLLVQGEGALASRARVRSLPPPDILSRQPRFGAHDRSRRYDTIRKPTHPPVWEV